MICRGCISSFIRTKILPGVHFTHFQVHMKIGIVIVLCNDRQTNRQMQTNFMILLPYTQVNRQRSGKRRGEERRQEERSEERRQEGKSEERGGEE